MQEKFSVAQLNVKSSEMFEEARAFAVRNAEDKKKADKVIQQVLSEIADAKKGLDSKDLSTADAREVSRAIDKLEITKNYLTKSMSAWNYIEDSRKQNEQELEKKRRTKQELIEARSRGKRVHVTTEEKVAGKK